MEENKFQLNGNNKIVSLKDLASENNKRTFLYSQNLSKLTETRDKRFADMGVKIQTVNRKKDKALIKYHKTLITKCKLLEEYCIKDTIK